MEQLFPDRPLAARVERLGVGIVALQVGDGIPAEVVLRVVSLARGDPDVLFLPWISPLYEEVDLPWAQTPEEFAGLSPWPEGEVLRCILWIRADGQVLYKGKEIGGALLREKLRVFARRGRRDYAAIHADARCPWRATRELMGGIRRAGMWIRFQYTLAEPGIDIIRELVVEPGDTLVEAPPGATSGEVLLRMLRLAGDGATGFRFE